MSDYEKTLILVRHAHRDKPNGSAFDNGISEKGHKQAQRVLKRFKNEVGTSKGVRLLSSPKKRCQETVEPIAEEAGLKLEISELLNEGGDVDARVSAFLAAWRKSSARVTIACSHGDWLPVAIEALTGVPHELAKGGWAEFRAVIFDEP